MWEGWLTAAPVERVVAEAGGGPARETGRDRSSGGAGPGRLDSLTSGSDLLDSQSPLRMPPVVARDRHSGFSGSTNTVRAACCGQDPPCSAAGGTALPAGGSSSRSMGSRSSKSSLGGPVKRSGSPVSSSSTDAGCGVTGFEALPLLAERVAGTRILREGESRPLSPEEGLSGGFAQPVQS